jgi:hypothetical protein
VFHFENSSNMPKISQKMKKSHVQLSLNPFVHGTTVPETGFDSAMDKWV